MAEQGYKNRLGTEAKGGIVLGVMLTLGTVIAILVPTVGPATRKRR